MRRTRGSTTGGLTSAIVIIGLVLALTFHSFNLPVFFIALAIAIFVGSLSGGNPQRMYGGVFGAMWMLILALFFITHIWQLFLVGAAISALLGTFMRPIIAWLLSNGMFGLSSPQPQQYYTPPSQPQQYYTPPSQPQPTYQQGYQAPPPVQQPETYKEGEKQYYYPPQPSQQYDEPQSQYPQQMPPQ